MSEAVVVIKLGSALLSHPTGLNRSGIDDWCRQIARQVAQGQPIVVVSSGAVAAGVVKLGLPGRPTEMRLLQATAAVGQLEVMNAYSESLSRHQCRVAMVLLTHADMANRARYLNARDTLMSLLEMGVVPIINENDSVATDEIRFGDNDTLAAMVTSLLGGHLLVLLTDQDGLHERDPRLDPSAPLISSALASDLQLDAMAGGPGSDGRGGMISKIAAARLASRSGADTIIARGSQPDVINAIFDGTELGTRLKAGLAPLDARKRWIADQLRPKGDLHIDAGAVQALRHHGVSLLPIGVVRVEGKFQRGDLVRCLSTDGALVAQGLVSYDADQALKIIGHSGAEISELLGFSVGPALVHRDNLVVF